MEFELSATSLPVVYTVSLNVSHRICRNFRYCPIFLRFVTSV